MINKRFKLFQCCIPVKGANRGVIIDLQRKTFYIVPNEIIDIIDNYKEKRIIDLLADFKEDKPVLKKFIKYFLENELIIISDEIESLPSISKEFIKPFDIDTVSIEINELSSYQLDFFENQIDELGVNCIKLILRESVAKNLTTILKLLENSKIQFITLFLEYNEDIEEDIEKIKASYPRLVEVIFYNYIEKGTYVKRDNFYYEISSLENILFKQICSINDFVINIDAYIESLNFNLIYNRTIYIDSFGNVKHTINDKGTYGNLAIDALSNIVNEDFKEFWKITKDKIEVCRDCEFRYICPDGRVPNKESNTDGYYTNKLKCNYDPYQNKWNS